MNRYEINISLLGQHFGTVDLKTNSRAVALDRFQLLAARLPVDLGYKLELTEWPTPLGTGIASTEQPA